jgi:hypothetical protein
MIILLIIAAACVVSTCPGQLGSLIPYVAIIAVITAAVKFRKGIS